MLTTEAITMVGDSQKFHIGSKSFLFRSGLTDRWFSSSALRVPQQDLFGDSLLDLALLNQTDPVVHLGDALDLACTDEWREFVRMMNHSKRKAWFWTVGNHDGFFFGNFVGPPDQWGSACYPEKPITKDVIVREYLTTHLAAYAGADFGARRGSWACPPNADCRGLRRVAWSIHTGDAYHRSYIVQEIELKGSAGSPAGSLILLDTTAYDRPPRISLSEARMRYAAGEAGNLGGEQRALLKQWVARAVGTGRAVVLAGHHPLHKLDEQSRVDIDQLVMSRRALTYISADTHWGQYFKHVSPNGYSWLEANLGSIVDYEAEFATLQIGFEGTSRFVKMPRTPVASVLLGNHAAELGIECELEWLALPEADDFYTRYRATASPRPATAELLYYSTMLAALDRYWRCVPTTPTAEAMPDECVVKTSCNADSEVHASIAETLASRSLDKIRAMAVTLVERDRSRNANPCLRRAYKVCQSLWAAEYELREYITPVKGQDLFEIGTAR